VEIKLVRRKGTKPFEAPFVPPFGFAQGKQGKQGKPFETQGSRGGGEMAWEKSKPAAFKPKAAAPGVKISPSSHNLLG
jgi:hypothetical protein